MPEMLNREVVDKVLQGTNLYQLGVPNPTQVGIERTFRFMRNPNNGDIWNTFVQGLFRLIGTQLIRNREYINPLAKFKRVNINRQQSIQEIGYQLVKARAYDQFDTDSFWKEHPPEIDVAYHTQNRQDKYKISVNSYLLESAFLQEYGLANFVSGALQQPINSDNHDEYLIMLDLIAKYENKWGFHKIQVPELTGQNQSEAEYKAKQFVKAVRTIAGKWALDYSTLYNGYNLPVFTPLGKTYLITTPEVMASVDVDVLAAAFNVSNAELQQRTILVSEIPVDNCLALLVDEDWFVCGDTLYQNESFRNPETLSINYFLHHWSVLSTSPMLNCVAFVTTEGTVNETLTVTPTTFDIGIFNKDGESINSIDPSKRNYAKGFLTWTTEPEDDNFPPNFRPTDFEITWGGKPLEPATATATYVSETITAVNVDVDTYGDYVDEQSGTETYDYSDAENLASMGITVTGTFGENDTITVTYVAAKPAEPVSLNSRTYIGKDGLIHLQAALQQEGMSVEITGTSTYNTDGVGTAESVSKTTLYPIA